MHIYTVIYKVKTVIGDDDMMKVEEKNSDIANGLKGKDLLSFLIIQVKKFLIY